MTALLTAAVAVGGLSGLREMAQERQPSVANPPASDYAGPITAWPRPVPARLQPQGRDELFVTTLGDVSTPLADGVFDPVRDRLSLTDGRVLDGYYASQLGIEFYRPIDKSAFPLPPSGWCSWYYYYQEINADEVLADARWLAEHLGDHGARYVQIDDGWQGSGHGAGDNRDWTTVDARFRDPGMAALADSIRTLGLEAGLWLAPHGQSNEDVALSSGAFLLDAENRSLSRTWVGDFLLDPTAAATPSYLNDLFQRLRAWGYSYFKLDGQPVVLEEYADKLGVMAGSIGADGDGVAAVDGGRAETIAEQLYRGTLRTIRQSVGERTYLLGSWGIPLPGVGLLNGSRTAGDVVAGWEGFLTAAEAVQRWNFLHNIAWYSDPDVLMVRPPLGEGMARAWATIQGLSGQALMNSDRLPDLPLARLEILKRVYPAVDVRPLDLYKPSNVRKPIWDLKVSHLGRSYDVVAAFNYGTEEAVSRLISWADLGLDPNQAYHVFDFWQGIYLGAWKHGVFLTVPPADVRVVTLVAEGQRPVLLSTSRHITQGWVELVHLESGGSLARPTLAGRSRLLAREPYTLTLGLPRARSSWRLSEVEARAAQRSAPVRVSWSNHRGYATVTLESDAAQEVEWRLRFEATAAYELPARSPARLAVEPVDLSSVALRWPIAERAAAYRVELDGQPVGIAFEPAVRLRDLVPGRAHKIGVRGVWSDGSSAEPTMVEFTPARPDVVYLSDMESFAVRHESGPPGLDRSAGGNALTVARTVYAKGLGLVAPAELSYRTFGVFSRFRARVGIDDEMEAEEPAAGVAPASAVFEVWGDGRRLWSSAPIQPQQDALAVDIDVTGVRDITLRVTPANENSEPAHADWLDARLIAAPGPS